MSMNSVNRIIAPIYLYNCKAFKTLSCEGEAFEETPAELARKFSDCGVDEIIVFDKSPSNDIEHEKALDIIKEICKVSDVPVIGAGNVKRMEDIKKLLYAGCKKACLNFSKASNINILEEVSAKFGKDKIVICFSEIESVNSNKTSVEKFAGELVKICRNISDNSLPEVNLPIIALYDENTDFDIADFLKNNDLICAITGEIILNNINNISSIKDDCISAGIKISQLEPAFTWDELKKNSDGMVPVIVQDYRTDQVLMLAYMNEESYNKTLSTGKMTYFSRSRKQLWLKGKTSSHYQYVMSLTADCDMDTILAKVKQIGAACHTGSYSCFFNEIASKDYNEKNPQKVLDSVFDVIKDRKVNPREGSYTNYLFDKGLDKILKKVGEEATEMVIAAKNPNSNEIVYEMSDFLYHMMVLMAEKNVSWEDITDELSRR